MTEPQELRSIDELYRTTFENLPDIPADTGWDTPSEHVWQHIRENMPTPAAKGGKGWSSWLLLASGVAVVALGLWLFADTSQQPAQESAPVTPPQPEQTVVAAPAEEAVPEAATPAGPAPTKTKVSKPTAAQTRPAIQRQEQSARALPSSSRQSVAAPLPGSKVSSPNTTEERKQEHARQLDNLWKTPLEPLPVPSKKQKTPGGN